MLAVAFLDVVGIAVMQHTNCALAGRRDDDIRSDLPAARAAGSEDWEFLTMPDPDGALRADVGVVRARELLPGDVRVEGWRYSVATGLIVQVIAS